MKCRAIIKKRKSRIDKCNKQCNFIYCKNHWEIKYKRLFKLYFALSRIQKVTVKIIGGVLLVYGLYEMIIKVSSNDHVKGKLLPISPQHKKYYEIDVGAKMTFPIQTHDLQNGFSLVNLPGFGCMPLDLKTPDFSKFIQPCDLMIKLKDGKLYISVTIRDYDGEIIGRLKDNKWEVKPNKITASDDSNNHFEILDKMGNVAFRLEVDEKSIIHVRGYFIKETCSIFLTDSSMHLVSDDRVNIDKVKFKNISENRVKYCKFYTNE